jgi:hypothetical protein
MSTSGGLRGRVRPWIVLALALGLLGFFVLDGAAAGVVLAVAAVAAFVGALRHLREGLVRRDARRPWGRSGLATTPTAHAAQGLVCR